MLADSETFAAVDSPAGAGCCGTAGSAELAPTATTCC